MATTPPVSGWCDTRRKEAARIISANAAGFGNLRIELDQIAIGLGVAGHRPADRRNDVERIKLVGPVEPRHVDVGKFETQEAPADPQHAVRFGQRGVDARHVADAERDGDGVERAVGQRQLFRVAFDEGHVEPLLIGARPADRKHLGVDVGDGDLRARAARPGNAERHVACAAGEVEQRERPLAFRRVDGGDQHVLPGAVQAARHQVVHQVVALGHAVEHAVDHRLLGGERHPAEAEIGLFSNTFGHNGPVRATIARWRLRRYNGAHES